MIKFREENPPIENLLLDPNNYRFQDDPDFIAAEDGRFHETTVQSRAYIRLRDDGLLQIKNSILKNGFLTVERVVVRDYPADTPHFMVVEGNRRVAALRWIQRDHEAGVEVPASMIETLRGVPVLVADPGEDEVFFEALMGIRHVSGIKRWGGYQRAKLVAQLRDQRGMESAEISDRFGMSTLEVNRRYRAFKALAQMFSDENFGEYARPDMYPLFHEAVSLTAVKDWLGWDETEWKFRNEEGLWEFYGLISPAESDESDESEGTDLSEIKITNRSEVRALKDIIPNAQAKSVLLDPVRTLQDALTIARSEELSQAWKAQVASVITALESIAIRDIRNMTEADLEAITKLKDSAVELLETYGKLRS